MSKYADTPWTVGVSIIDGDVVTAVLDSHGDEICNMGKSLLDEDANASRIVACVNACRHLITKHLEAGDLDYAGCSTLADIRASLGVGEKPMLSELAGIVREIREQADRDERVAVQLERGIQFWRNRCRELKAHMRKIEDMANESPNAGRDAWQMLADISNAVHDALNGKEPTS